MIAAALLVLLASTAQVPVSVLDPDASTWILSGWVTARAAAASGGQADVMNTVSRALERIERWRADAAGGTTPRDAMRALELQYADATLHAAIDAALDERDEMGVYLMHARDLSRQLDLLGGAARWPLPIDEVDGELWFEVDRYAESRDAYTRAAEATNSPRAWIGLARAYTRLGDNANACTAYRRALQTQLMPDWQTEAETIVGSAACSPR
ncbi:MAG: hypothetical protein ABI665_15310 [Vicinamibacterales bacterium]